MKRVRLGLALGLMAVAAVAVLGPVSSAFGLTAGVLGIEVKSPVTLQAKGAAVTVPLDVVCTGGAFIDLRITQRVGAKSLADGFGEVPNLACTGDVQRVIVAVAAQGAPFRKGQAFVHVDIQQFTDVFEEAVVDTVIDVAAAPNK